MHTFELMLGYAWWAICHTIYKDNSHAQTDLCCILLEYSLMHTHKETSGTRVLAQNVPTSIFQARSFGPIAELNAAEIARITCARITTRDFHSS